MAEHQHIRVAGGVLKPDQPMTVVIWQCNYELCAGALVGAAMNRDNAVFRALEAVFNFCNIRPPIQSGRNFAAVEIVGENVGHS